MSFHFTPPPQVDDPETAMTRAASDDAPFSALAFKIMTDPFVGSLTFCRIYSGKLDAGTYALNSNKGKKERIGRLMLMHANNREDIKSAFAGVWGVGSGWGICFVTQRQWVHKISTRLGMYHNREARFRPGRRPRPREGRPYVCWGGGVLQVGLFSLSVVGSQKGVWWAAANLALA
jgi:hypothetical protein